MSVSGSAADLPKHLLDIGARHVLAAFAVQTARGGSFETVEMAQHAGAAVELLSKGIVAAHHPALVLELGSVAKRWQRVFVSSEGLEALRDVRSIQAGAALAVAHGILNLTDSDPFAAGSLILNERNAAVHLGLPPKDSALLLERLALWLRVVGEAGVQFPQGVENAIADRIVEVMERVTYKLAAARRRFSESTELRYSLDAGREGEADYVDPVRCPACEGVGTLLATVVNVEREWTGGDELMWEVLECSFHCSTCGLELSDAELEAGDIRLQTLEPL